MIFTKKQMADYKKRGDIDVLEIMRKNKTEIRNPTGYLYSLILNTVNAGQAETILELPGGMIGREMLYASD